MTTILWLLVFIGGAGALAWYRASLLQATLAAAAFLLLYSLFGSSTLLAVLGWLVFAAIAVPLNYAPLRQQYLTRPAFAAFRKVLPPMSDTEREALAAGSVAWEGALFSGAPDWDEMLRFAPPTLSAEERAFIDGPVEELCAMLDEWDITHERADLSPEAWAFIKSKGFFAMIIPKRFGGLEFSAFAHSTVLGKISSRSATAASMVAVPNSLGPAELLLHYGTPEQQDHYLPRLASGEEIPCFALTGPTAGSDAASIPDFGIVCKGEWEGREVLGLKLTFDKRYITLAPIATVVGLAFRLYDPDHLVGDEEDRGITVALLPRDTPGLKIGRRHFPLNIPFHNGPLSGDGVFVPLDTIIGGQAMIGQGWRMLMESLAVGRSISLPANATGGAKFASHATGAYARVRRQFGMPIGKFEGIEEALARIGGYTYTIDALRGFTAAAVDSGEKPAVASAIAKYHATELGRVISNDAMDVHGGKGICLGPRNWLARGWQVVPVAITVEGANILTRSLIIFGQGAIRCHPFVLDEMEAARDPDEEAGFARFEKALLGHVGFALSNSVRSFVLALTQAKFSRVPRGPTGRYYQHLTRFAASFALVADVAMLVMGGDLKRREKLSGRLGDLLSHLYMSSAILKKFEDEGRQSADLPLVEWALRTQLYRLQEQMHGFLRNFPLPAVAGLLRVLVFPLGRTYSAPSDLLGHEVAELLMESPAVRDRLCAGIYAPTDPEDPVAQLGLALKAAVSSEAAFRKVRDAERDGSIDARNRRGLLNAAREAGVISDTEHEQLVRAADLAAKVIAVDDFDFDALGRSASDGKPALAEQDRGDSSVVQRS
ncbi:MAG: acyl-CoA dehydrogenase [Gammaproteobacteria bacterium]